MFCKQCGTALDDSAVFCTSCGTSLREESNAQESDPFVSALADSAVSSKSRYSPSYINLSLVLGIMSIVFSVMNYLGIYFTHLLGIAFGITGIILVNKDKKKTYQFSKGGLITSIIGLSLGVLAFIIGGVLAVLAM